MKLDVTVSSKNEGRRAVDVLMEQTGMSRQLAKKIRLHGTLTCNDRFHRMIDPVKGGDRLKACLASKGQLRPVKGAPLLFGDDWLALLSKPAGMVVHPTHLHHQGSLTDLLSDEPLHPVLRLDRDTTGVVLIARNGHAHHVLSQHPMKKSYVGLVHGALRAPHGLIQAPIARHESSIMLRKVDPKGAQALTVYDVLKHYRRADVSFVRFTLLTGRTHQIRVHCQAIGHPLLGDELYGSRDREQATDWDRLMGRQALHAAALTFRHPVERQNMTVTAPLPQDFRNVMDRLEATRQT